MDSRDGTGRSPSASPKGVPGSGDFASLSDFAIFSGLDPASLAELSEGVRQRTWPSGGLIFSRGDQGDHMLAIRRGRIRLSLSSARGREIVLQSLGPGDILGEMALIDGEPRSADATAAQETTCLVLPRARFAAVVPRRPDVGLALARHLCRLLRSTNFQMESIALHDLQTRLVRFVLYALEKSPGAGSGPERRLVLGLSQGELSAILGASRPKVSAAFHGLLDAGVLRRDGAALVCDVEALSALAEGGQL